MSLLEELTSQSLTAAKAVARGASDKSEEEEDRAISSRSGAHAQ